MVFSHRGSSLKKESKVTILGHHELSPFRYGPTSRLNKKKTSEEPLDSSIGESDCDPPPHSVDIVYTWVNGSDPNFKSVFKKTDLGQKSHEADVNPQRFAGEWFNR